MHGKHPHFVIVGNPENRRVTLFQDALAELGLPPADIVAYVDLLNGRSHLEQVVRRGSTIRIESPGRNFEVEKLLLGLGAEAAEAEDSPWISRDAAMQLEFDRGRIFYPRQWYLGFCATLKELQKQLAGCNPHQLMNQPSDIAVMFDKIRCHALFSRDRVPTPKSLGAIDSFDDLVVRMQATNQWRVFIKLAHGSSASGVVAFATNGVRFQATTTVELVAAGEVKLYNSRRIRRYNDLHNIATIVNTLCRDRVQVEAWVPKASMGDRVFDLRVVAIAGQAKHAVVRLSKSPMTNLHLKNERSEPTALIAKMGAKAWENAIETCEQAARIFPNSLYTGIDLLIPIGFKQPLVLEANAFGDLLPDITHNGLDTYATEIIAALAQRESQKWE
jgi:hypothetical protein